MAYQITNQKSLRAAFWDEFATNPGVSRKRGKDGDYLTDTRLAWCDWIDLLARDGQISQALAQRATL